VTLFDLSEMYFRNGGVEAPRDERGIHLSLDMGTQRVNWNRAAWFVHELPTPIDLPDGGLRLRVRTDSPRHDAGVYVALRERDGTWFYHPWACALATTDNQGTARFDDFVPAEFCQPPGGHFIDENGFLDRRCITAIAIGCVNGLGVGVVDFTLVGLDLLELPSRRSTVHVRVGGRPLDVNGQTTIPAGAFGYYLGPKNEPERTYRLGSSRKIVSTTATDGEPFFATGTVIMSINCVGERIWPSVRLTDPQWREHTDEFAKRIALAAGDHLQGMPFHLEYYNEPYLNWANVNRANFIPRFYDESRAVEGGAVHVLHDGVEVPHLRWTKDYSAPRFKWCAERDWRRGRDESGKVYSVHARPYHKGTEPLYGGPYLPATHPPLLVRDGAAYTAQLDGQTLTLTAFTPWHVHDETQFTYWSGAAQTFFYIEQARVLGESAKRAYPQTQFVVGWGIRPSEDNWAAWKLLYQPTLDALIDLADGFHEHDYGGHPLKMAANYETVVAYAVTKHGKRLKGYNTEQGANFDPQAYPEAAGLSRDELAMDARYRFASRKLLHLLSRCPDKVAAITHFDFKEEGEGLALLQLRDLRGTLLHTRCDDERVFVVASLDDGSDPSAPRPPGDDPTPRMVVAVLNDNVRARDIRLEISPPRGMTALRGHALRRDGRRVVEEPLSLPETGGTVALSLAPFELRSLVIDLAGTMEHVEPVRRRQLFLDAILREVCPSAPLAGELKVPAEVLASASSAWARLAVERVAEGAATLVVNGKAIVVPHAITPENAPMLRDIPIDAGTLRDRNRIELHARDGSAGFLLCSASVIVDSR
jgi:hypothetical protein